MRVGLTIFLTMFGAFAASAQGLDPERVFNSGVRGVSALRLLGERSMEMEYPSSGHFALVATQVATVLVRPVGASADVESKFARTSIQVGWGWERVKLGFFLDGLSLGNNADFFLGGVRSGGSLSSGDLGLAQNIVLTGSGILNRYTSIIAGVSFSKNKLNTSATAREESSITPLVRARLCGYTGEIGFPRQNESLSLGAFLNSLDVAGVLWCVRGGDASFEDPDRSSRETGSALADFFLGFRPVANYYGAGSNPFILDLANPNVSEAQAGLEWASFPDWPVRLTAKTAFAVSGDSGFRLAEIGFDASLAALPFRIVGPLTSPEYLYNLIPAYPVTFLGGIGAPGATFAGIGGRVFLVRIDERVRFGFSVGARVEVFTNNARRRSGGDSHYDGLLRDWEGEHHEYIRSFLELRVSRNDMFSTGGVPIADEVAFGLVYSVEIFDKTPIGHDRGRYHARYLNAALDGDDEYGPADEYGRPGSRDPGPDQPASPDYEPEHDE